MLMKRLRLALLIGGGALCAATAYATSLKQLSFSDLVDQADLVVVGQAKSSRTISDASGVSTVTTFEVEDAVIGAPAGEVDVVTPGGAFKPGKFRVSESTADTPMFPVGTETLLFLDPAASGDYQIVGFSQGAIKVVEVSGEKMVRLPDADRDESVPQAKSRIRAEKSRGKKRGDMDSDD
jgi:hypothetical protein